MPRILLDDPAHAGGSDQLLIGTLPNDGTGDAPRTAGQKFKQWAADQNSMNAELYAAKGFSGSLSPTALSASQDNYTPSGYVAGTTNRLLLTPASGGSTLKGLLAATDGWALFIVNISTTDSITFSHLAGTSLAANRFSCAGAIPAVLGPLDAVLLVYVVNQWIVQS